MEVLGSIFTMLMIFVLIRSLFWAFLMFYNPNKTVKKPQDQVLDEDGSNDPAYESEQKVKVYQPEMVKDLECGEYIDKSKAYIAVVDGKRYYFCSWDCRQKFIEAN